MVIAICLLYVSLLLELVFFHVPSVANTQVFFTRNTAIINSYNQYRYVFYWNKMRKTFLLIVPHFLNLIVFFAPFFLIFFQKNNWDKLATIGLALAVLGRLVSFFSMLSIRKNNSQKNNDYTLHTRGVFRFSRNPIQLGMYLFYGGICIINFHFILIVCFLFYFLYNDFRIRIEEDFLSVKFNDLYTNYKLKTRRYI